MNRNYVRGRDIEYRVAALYRARGYQTFLTSGSRGFFDVHAFNHAETVYVQCKRSLERWTLAQAAGIFALLPLMPPGARFELWVWVERVGWTVYQIQDAKGIVCTRDDSAPKQRRCECCKKTFTPRPTYKAQMNKIKYCSRKCKVSALNKKFYANHRERVIAGVLAYQRRQKESAHAALA